MENRGVITLPWTYLGVEPYKTVWDLQDRIRTDVLAGEAAGEVLVTEHPPTISLGRAEKGINLLFSQSDLKTKGFEVVESNRGGKVTYHGPGQLVVYPVIDLRMFKMGVKQYVYALEATMISILDKLEIQADRKEKCPGAWVNGKKIGSIGIHVRKQVATHGFALNIEPQMQHFDVITPCGLGGVQMTSVQTEGGKQSLIETLPLLVESFEEIFGCKLLERSLEERQVSSHV